MSRNQLLRVILQLKTETASRLFKTSSFQPPWEEHCDSGLDSGLDYGLDSGLDSGLDRRSVLVLTVCLQQQHVSPLQPELVVGLWAVSRLHSFSHEKSVFIKIQRHLLPLKRVFVAQQTERSSQIKHFWLEQADPRPVLFIWRQTDWSFWFAVEKCSYMEDK